MNITLRKANAIQLSILDAIKSINIKTTIALNEFQEITKEVSLAQSTLMTNDGRRHELLVAMYNIRQLVSTANCQAGIDVKLSTSALLDKRIAQLEELSKIEPMTSLEVVSGQLDKIKARPADARTSLYGHSDTVSTTVLTKDHLEKIKSDIKSMKKQKQKLNDELLELNIRTEVTLSESVVTTLTSEGLI
jgi:hypothetical protein